MLPWPVTDKEPRGAVHSQDEALIFGLAAVTQINDMNFRYTPPALRVDEYNFLSKAVMSYWAESAYTCAPGKGRRGELPEWKPWNNSPGAPKYLLPDSPAEENIHMSVQYVTKADVLKRLEHDARLPTISAKCKFLAKLINNPINFEWITTGDYINVAGKACAKQLPLQVSLRH